MLNACINSSITYGCEAWSYGNFSPVNILHRKAIKMILGVRQNISNSIIYTESDTIPIENTIKCQQLKYWIKINEYGSNKPESHIWNIITTATHLEIPFIKYYQQLESTYQNPIDCHAILKNEFIDSVINEFSLSDDQDSVLGTYKSINPTLTTLNINSSIIEPDRLLITRYRTGSHHLKIETGRWSCTERNLRICDKCNLDKLQSLNHMITECVLTSDYHFNGNLENFFASDTCVKTLKFIDSHCKL